MDQAHIHVLITHLPIFGSILGAFVLAHGLWTNSAQTKIAAYNVFILAAAGGAVAYLTGEGAEETVENIPGIAETAIELHEDTAVYTLISLIVLGVAAIAGLVLTMKKSSLTKTSAVALLVLSLISFGLAARTGYLGGQIRHTEFSTAAGAQDVPAQEHGEVEED